MQRAAAKIAGFKHEIAPESPLYIQVLSHRIWRCLIVVVYCHVLSQERINSFLRSNRLPYALGERIGKSNVRREVIVERGYNRRASAEAGLVYALRPDRRVEQPESAADRHLGGVFCCWRPGEPETGRPGVVG